MANLPNTSDTNPTRTAPIFLVGRDGVGHWLAVETHGLGCGFFTTQDAAMRYARSETAHRPGAVVLSPSPLGLSRA